MTTQGGYDESTGVWSVGTLFMGTPKTLTITATVDGGTGNTFITNTASVTAKDQADFNPSNDSAIAVIDVQLADVAITKEVDNATPNEGDTVTYTVTVTNNGPDTATNVEVTDELPPGVTFVSSVTTQGTYDETTDVWSIGTLANGASETLVIAATVDAGTGGTTITNTASITASDQDDPVDGNNSNDVDIDVIPTGPQNVNELITLDGPPSTSLDPTPRENAPAGVFTISVTFTNNSAKTLSNLSFEVAALTGGNLLLNADGGAGGVGSIVSVPSSDLGDDGVLSPGESFTVTFEIGLAVLAPFTFFVDAFGIPSP